MRHVHRSAIVTAALITMLLGFFTVRVSTQQTIPQLLTEIEQRIAAIRALLPPPTCTFALASASASVPAAASTGAVAVTTQPGCAWTASSSASWATVTGGSGSGSASYSAAANTATAARSATLTIGGQTFTLTQAGAAPQTCTYSISPTGQAPPASGGSGGTTVTTVPATGCPWTAVVNAAASSWLSVTSGASGNGSGAVGMTATANSGPARVGTVLVAGQTFTASQAGSSTPAPQCSDGVDNDGDMLADFPNDPGCTSATDTDETNAAPGCTVTLSPTSASAPAAAPPAGSVTVTATPAGCAWTASSAVAWLTVGAGGASPLSYTVAANTGAARTGFLTIGGQSFTVNQAGTPTTGGILWQLQATAPPLFGLRDRWGTQSGGTYTDYTMATLSGGGPSGQDAVRFTYRNGGFAAQGYLGGTINVQIPASGPVYFRGRVRIQYSDTAPHTAKHILVANGSASRRPILTWGTHYGEPNPLQLKMQTDGGSGQILGQQFARNTWLSWQVELSSTGYALWTNGTLNGRTNTSFSAADRTAWGTTGVGFFHNDPASGNIVVDIADVMVSTVFDPNWR